MKKLKKLSNKNLYAIIVGLFVTILGTILLVGSRAANPYASVSAYGGSTSGSATKLSNCVGAINTTCVSFGTQTATSSKMIGIDGTYTDTNYDYIQNAKDLGAQWMRVEQWGDGCPESYSGCFTVPQIVDRLAAKGIGMLPLVNNYPQGYEDSAGKTAWVNALVNAAEKYGKGGTYWQGKAVDLGSPVVEAGNEVYGCRYQSNGAPATQCTDPADYALMLKQAGMAVDTATNGRVKVIASVTGDYKTTGGTWDHWSSDMLAAVPDLQSYIGGIVIHAYGAIPSIGIGSYQYCYGTTSSLCQQTTGTGTTITQSGNTIIGQNGANFANSLFSDGPNGGTTGYDLQGATITYADGTKGVVTYVNPTTLTSSVSKTISSPQSYQLGSTGQAGHQALYSIHSLWNASMPVYVTEEGQKASGTSGDSTQVGYSEQCKAMNYYFDEFRNNPWQSGVFWYNQKDYQAFNPSGDNGWALMDQNNFEKPAWYAYQSEATKQTDYPSC
ncbi:MAG: hypothetical protein ACHQT9_00865 [Candidatus Saccharimonadales bacterium]